MEKLFYVETEIGCGIRTGTDEDEVYDEEVESIGTYHSVRLVREATKKDIAWVRTMGGYIPKLT